MTSQRRNAYDALVIGGGPSGATAALVLARAGLAVRLVERADFPRFHIGESFLPRNLTLIRDLGLEPALRAIPQTDKRGAEFAIGDGRHWRLFPFSLGLGDDTEAFNIERAPFDAMLLDSARAAGAEVDVGRAVRRIVKLADGEVVVALDGEGEGAGGEEIAARVLIDASGQATVVGKHLGTRRVLPDLKKVAYFAHFDNVERRQGLEGGFPTMVMCKEGWFWVIPLDERRTSIGLVMDAEVARQVGVPPNRMLGWGIQRCPLLRRRTAKSARPETNLVAADFTYKCSPYSGPGYFLVGDAATFVDPIFSTGVCLGMMSAVEAGRGAISMLRDGADARPIRRRYNRFVERSSSPFFRFVRTYYDHSFRELFLHGQGPLAVHRAAISVLAGAVFPRPRFALRWRLQLFFLLVRLNRYLPLVPRRPRFSLLAAAPGDAAAADGEECLWPGAPTEQASP